MGAEVTPIEEEGIIAVREFGDLTLDELTASLRRIRELHEQTGLGRVLVDAREQLSRTEGLDAYSRATLAVTELLPARLRIAVVVAERLRDGHEFFETVSRNRGLHLRLFDDDAAARAWLAS